MNEKKSWFMRILAAVFFPQIIDTPAYREKYRKGVIALADNMENRRFLNDKEWHAEMVAGLMVSRAIEDEELLIYSYSLEPRYYAKVLCDSKCHIRILLENIGHTNALDVIRALPQEVQDRIDFRVAYAPRGERFLTVGNSVRCGADDSGNELFMVCNFNEPDAARRLRDRFEAMWEKSPPWSFAC